MIHIDDSKSDSSPNPTLRITASATPLKKVEDVLRAKRELEAAVDKLLGVFEAACDPLTVDDITLIDGKATLMVSL